MKLERAPPVSDGGRPAPSGGGGGENRRVKSIPAAAEALGVLAAAGAMAARAWRRLASVRDQLTEIPT